MDSSVANTDLVSCSSVATEAQKAPRKLPNLDLKCYLNNAPERKINLYMKHTVSSAHSQRKVSKRTLPLVSPTIDDRSVKTSPRDEVASAEDSLELGLNSECLDSKETRRKSLTPVSGVFIRDMVERFDNQPQSSFNGVQVNTPGSMSHESFKNITKKCSDSLQSPENACLMFRCDGPNNFSQRVRSRSETVGKTEKTVHYTRSTKPTTAPKPKFYLKKQLDVADCKDESSGSVLTKLKAELHSCTDIPSSCDSDNAKNSTTNATSLSNSFSISMHDNDKHIPAGNRVGGCDVQELCTAATELDISSGSKRLGE